MRKKSTREMIDSGFRQARMPHVKEDTDRTFQKEQKIQIRLYYCRDGDQNTGHGWFGALPQKTTEESIVRECYTLYPCGISDSTWGWMGEGRNVWATVTTNPYPRYPEYPDHGANCHCGQVQWRDEGEEIAERWQAAFKKKAA